MPAVLVSAVPRSPVRSPTPGVLNRLRPVRVRERARAPSGSIILVGPASPSSQQPPRCLSATASRTTGDASSRVAGSGSSRAATRADPVRAKSDDERTNGRGAPYRATASRTAPPKAAPGRDVTRDHQQTPSILSWMARSAAAWPPQVGTDRHIAVTLGHDLPTILSRTLLAQVGTCAKLLLSSVSCAWPPCGAAADSQKSTAPGAPETQERQGQRWRTWKGSSASKAARHSRLR